jgi:hypothetical protein
MRGGGEERRGEEQERRRRRRSSLEQGGTIEREEWLALAGPRTAAKGSGGRAAGRVHVRGGDQETRACPVEMAAGLQGRGRGWGKFLICPTSREGMRDRGFNDQIG